MNILYIEHYAGSPEMGMEFRPYYLSREWIKMGHNVRIIAGDYSHLRRINPKVDVDFQEELIDGINYYWIKTGKYKGNGIARAFTMFRFVKKLRMKARWIAQNWKPDVIITSSTYPLDTYAGQKIRKFTKKKDGDKAVLIHEVHDMWPATLIEIGGMSKNNPFVMLMQFAENSAYKHSDAVVSLAKYAKSYMMKHGLKENKFFYIPNGIVEEEWDNPEPLPEEHEEKLLELKHEGKFIVGYFGGHALSNCLLTLLQSSEQIQNQNKTNNVHFVLVGEGIEKENLIKYANKRELTNITFLPAINKKAIPNLTEYFDCIYIGTKKSPLYRFGVCMNKMFDGMMAGKPIIFAIDAPPTLVEECKCGLTIKSEDVNSIVNAIFSMMTMSKLDKDIMGNRGRKEIIEKYTYLQLAQKFIEVMTQVISF